MNKKTIIISLLWLVLCIGLFYDAMIIVLMFNLFSWHFEIDWKIIALLVFAIIAIIASYFLSRKTQYKVEQWVAFVSTVLLAGFGLFVFIDFYQETISHSLLGRSQLSPQWFRISVLLLYCFPLFMFITYRQKD